MVSLIVVLNTWVCRHYSLEVQQRVNLRNAFAQAWTQDPRTRNKRVEYPTHLSSLSPFDFWIREAVRDPTIVLSVPGGASLDVLSLSNPPSWKVLKYKSIKAFGNHYRVNVDGGMDWETYDCGIGAFFQEEVGTSSPNWKLSFVGILSDIWLLDYGIVSEPVILMKGKWVHSVWERQAATMKQDDAGFTVANFGKWLPNNHQPFIFPWQVQQIFFSDAPELNKAKGDNWKVILHKEPRERRVQASYTNAPNLGELSVIGMNLLDSDPLPTPQPSLVGAIVLSTKEMVIARTNYRKDVDVPISVSDEDDDDDIDDSESASDENDNV